MFENGIMGEMKASERTSLVGSLLFKDIQAISVGARHPLQT